MNQSIDQQAQPVSQPQWSADRRRFWNGQAWVAAQGRKTPWPLVVSIVLGSLSLGMLVVGAGAALLESNNHSVCEGGLGQMAQAFNQDAAAQCAAANFYFYGGLVVAFLGGIMLLAAIIVGITGAMRRT